jgi:hypothetical protein
LFDNVAYIAYLTGWTKTSGKKIVGGIERLRKSLRDQLLENEVRNYNVVNPLWQMVCSKISDEVLHASSDHLWRSDPGHSCNEGYKKLVDGLKMIEKSSWIGKFAQPQQSSQVKTGLWPE